MLKISIVIPVYNSDRYIKECVYSILQNEQDVEIIIVDDGSNDQTQNICEILKNTYNNIKYIRQENAGVSAARNRGIREVTSDYIMFIDSDDYLSKGYLAEIKKTGADFVMSGFTYVYEGSNKREEMLCPFFEGDIDRFLNIFEKWISPPFILSPWGKLFRTDIIRNNNLLFPENMSYGEDVAFVYSYLRFSETVVTINNPGYCYRVNFGPSLSQNFKKDMFAACYYDFTLLKNLFKQKSNDRNDICYRIIVHDFCCFARKLVLSKAEYKEKRQIFYETNKRFDVVSLFDKVQCLTKSEKIVKLALSNEFLFPVLFLFILRERLG